MGSAASLASGSSSDPERSLVCARFSSRRAPSSFSSTSSSSSCEGGGGEDEGGRTPTPVRGELLDVCLAVRRGWWQCPGSVASSSESRREMRVEARETLPRSGNMSSAAAASTAARPTSSYSRFSASAGGSLRSKSLACVSHHAATLLNARLSQHVRVSRAHFPLLKLLLSERSRRSAVVRAHLGRGSQQRPQS